MPRFAGFSEQLSRGEVRISAAFGSSAGSHSAWAFSRLDRPLNSFLTKLSLISNRRLTITPAEVAKYVWAAKGRIPSMVVRKPPPASSLPGAAHGNSEGDGFMLQERQQVDFGSRIALKDASRLPQGCWVSIQTGILYEAKDGHSLAAVVSAEPQEFLLVGTPDRTPYPQMRQRAREHGVEPQF